MNDTAQTGKTSEIQIRNRILQVMRDVAKESDKTLAAELTDDSVLLEIGLDSLDFAIVVARLEEEWKDDPFASLDEPVYPKTIGELVGIYARHFAQ